MKKTLPYLLTILILLSSCATHSYFTSPTNASSNPYHTIPLKSDSIKGATYLNGLVTLGGQNSDWRDGIMSFQGRIYRSNNFENFQVYYGANLSLGSYHVAEYYLNENIYPYDTGSYHILSSNNFFGTYGFNGGINTVIPFGRNGSEWRAIGIETSVQKEFGSYYNFRKNLNDSAADVIFKKNTTATVGIFSDIIKKSLHGSEFGYKVGFGFMLNPFNEYSHVYNSNDFSPITYFSNTLHLTKGNVTGFMQLNLSNYFAGNFQFGFSYKLGAKPR